MAYTPYSGPSSSSVWQPLPSQYLPTPPTTLAFDPLSPLLFAATPNGTVTSYFCSPTTGLSGRYTSYRGHWGAVGEMAIDQTGVLSAGGGGGLPGKASAGNIKMANRRGLTLWSVDTEPPVPLTTFAYTPSRSSEIIATGPGSDLFVVNVTRGSIVRKQPSSLPFLHLRRTTQLVGSTLGGSLALLDTRTPDISTGETVLAHTGGISQLEAEGNYIVTIGFTMRQGLPLPDPYLKLHDTRYLRPLSPIPFPTPPAFVRFHPRLSGNVVVASADGRVQLLDLKDVGKSSVFQVETPSMLTSMAISPTGEGLAFGDAEGFVHLWYARPEEGDAKFCRFEGEIELPDTVEPPERINWRDDTPLNSIGMPYYTSPLLSLLPAHMTDPSSITTSHRPIPIDPQILATAKTVDFVGYATYPAHLRAAGRRNQVTTGKGGKNAGRVGVDAPMFRSERERVEAKRRRERGESIDATAEAEEEVSEEDRMPKYYRKVEIKYSRFGIEDFDFAFYNKTRYSGLETHITNSYTNSLLQALHYLPPIRMLAESHTYEPCPKENCLLCEAGFLFRMLRDAKGMNCQASNFSRADVSLALKVTALGLIDLDNDSTKTVAYSTLIQTLNRYLLEQMTAESAFPPRPSSSAPNSPLLKNAPVDPSKPPLAQLVKVETKSLSVCQACGARSERDTGLNVIDLVYPRRVSPHAVSHSSPLPVLMPTRGRQAMSNEPPPSTSFTSILSASIARETIARLPCSACKQNTHVRIRRALPDDSQLPPVLVFNAGVRTADELELWMDGREGEGSRFLRSRFRLGRGAGGEAVVKPVVKEGKGDDEVEYELRAMVVQIQAEGDAPHLVALARGRILNLSLTVILAPLVSPEETTPGSSWHVFNDFLVRSISEQEALSFPANWKVRHPPSICIRGKPTNTSFPQIPAVLFYERVDSKEMLDFTSLPLKGDPAILCEDITISNLPSSSLSAKLPDEDQFCRNRDRSLIKHQPFRPEELPRRGTLVSIDAEFVSLQQEEAEFHSDGTKKVIRPSRMTLARVSVLRGEGPDTGIPFIDDHIHTSEPVVDYLTEFSGIRAGDLDPFSSRHTLVQLKVAYKKLRMLVDLGCVFIGHGLNKDFRIISVSRCWFARASSGADRSISADIYIPPEQIIDTVNIYHLPHRQRKLSLRFLAWAVLHSAIQSDTHDSIEDARTALQLYEHHNRLEAEGTWEETLEEVYQQGKQTNFKVPIEPPPPARVDSPGFGVGALGPLPNQQMFMRGVVPTPSGRSSRSFMS
ncbi:SPOSA6832_04843, partial [Sporobolomyces salmonicolor]